MRPRNAWVRANACGREDSSDGREIYFHRWTRSQGGLFLWVTLPESLDASEILPAAIAENVAFVPGSAFFADGSGHHTFRLNFSNTTPERIAEGIRRLGAVLEHVLVAHAAGAEPVSTQALPRGKGLPYG